MVDLVLRAAVAADRDRVAALLEPVLRAGETYALPPDWPCERILGYWFAPGHEVFVAEAHGALVGTYYLRANQPGPGDHVANAGYVTAEAARGRGVARAMGQHSLAMARVRGFRAMQFNCVVVTNLAAIRVWEGLGFTVVGRLPGAFRHPREGEVDALVMYRRLDG